LLTPPASDVGYRMYPHKVIQDIESIKRAQDLRFTLEKIKDLLAASNGDKEFHSEEMLEFASVKIDKKIRNLNEMKLLLEGLVEKYPCSGVPKSQCPDFKKISKGVN
jgi:DNA-binding transcriptional MerR regulator